MRLRRGSEMNRLHQFSQWLCARGRGQSGRKGRLALLCAAACLIVPGAARAQVTAPGDMGAGFLSAGVTGSAENVQYGQRRMTGITSFVDADSRRRLGFEFEGRWLEFRQTMDVHLETYSAGMRYHFDVGRRFQPYVKGLIGFGDFNFPENLGTGRYLVVTGGGGLDYRLTRRFMLRVPDVEYQDWPQFSYSTSAGETVNMTTPSVSVGLRVRIF